MKGRRSSDKRSRNMSSSLNISASGHSEVSVDRSSHGLLPLSGGSSHSACSDTCGDSLFNKLFGAVTVTINLEAPFLLNGDDDGIGESSVSFAQAKSAEIVGQETDTRNQTGQFGFLGLGDYRAALLNGNCSLSELDDIFVKARSFVFTNFGGKVLLLNPRSDCMFIWQLINLLFTLLCVFFVPIEVAFASESSSVANKQLGALLEFFFMLDIFVNCNLPIQNKNNQCLIVDRDLIWHRYSRSWLLVDILSCLPLDLIEIIVGQAGHDVAVLPSVVSVLRLSRIFKISKVTRLVRANMIIVRVQDFLHLSPDAVELLKLFFLVLLTIHFMGCGLFVVSHLERFYTSWEIENEIEGETTLTRYWAGIYWAGMTATTIGYGDIVMVTPGERMYCTLCMVIGASVYALVTSRLVGMLLLSRNSLSTSSMGSKSGEMTEYDATLRRFKFPLVFRSILTDYLHVKAKNEAMHQDMSLLMHKLSPQLRALTAGIIHGPWIENVPFITGSKSFNYNFFSLQIPSACRRIDIINKFAAEISDLLECQTYAPGEYVNTGYWKKVGNLNNEERRSLFIVNTENAIVYRRDSNGNLMNNLRWRDCFGVELILLDSSQCLFNYTYCNSKSGYCCVLAIAKSGLLATLKKFPALYKNYARHQIKLAFQLRVRKYLVSCAFSLRKVDTTSINRVTDET